MNRTKAPKHAFLEAICRLREHLAELGPLPLCYGTCSALSGRESFEQT